MVSPVRVVVVPSTSNHTRTGIGSASSASELPVLLGHDHYPQWLDTSAIAGAARPSHPFGWSVEHVG